MAGIPDSPKRRPGEAEEHGSSPKQIMTAADAALYQAKKAGRDRVVVAEGGVDLTPGIMAREAGA